MPSVPSHPRPELPARAVVVRLRQTGSRRPGIPCSGIPSTGMPGTGSRQIRAGRIRHQTIRGFLVAIMTMAFAAVVPAVPAEAASSGSLTARDDQTVRTRSIATMADGSVTAAFTVPRKRPATLSLGFDLRLKSNGDRYRIRAMVDRAGKLKLGILRYYRGRTVVLTERTLADRVKDGQTLWVDSSISGSGTVSVRTRAWLSGKAKPGWQRSAADSSGSRVTGSGATLGVVRLAPAPGTKKVTVAYRGLNAVVRAPAPTKPAPTKPAPGKPPAPSKPSAATTGVPAGTKLRVHNGDIVVTTAGTRLDALDIRGFVVVKAPNVTISRSIVRGGKDAKTGVGLITNYGSPNLLITDTELRASYPSVWLDGIKGWNFTARRVHVVGNVDSIKIHGDNVSVEDSLLEDTIWYPHDPYQNGGPTHNDNIQILNGKHIKITGNTIRGAQNFAVLGAANKGDVPDLVVSRNWLDGGHCTLKLQIIGTHALRATVTDNLFGPNRAVSYCPIQSLPGVELTARNNLYEQNGQPVPIYRRP
jgi:hypothetical protein